MREIFCRIIHGDSMKILPTLGENIADLILTDPPYNIATSAKLTKVGGEIISTEEAWGKDFVDVYSEKEYMSLWEKIASCSRHILKRTGSVITFFDRGKPCCLKPFYDQFTFRNMIVFIKRNPVPHIRKSNYLSGFEQCAWFSQEDYYIDFISQDKMVNVFYGLIGQKATTHPTEKYEWMIRPLIERHTREYDLVVDPFLGSGVVSKVARDMKRNSIGIEIREEYSKMAEKRVFGQQLLDCKVKYSYEEGEGGVD